MGRLTFFAWVLLAMTLASSPVSAAELLPKSEVDRFVNPLIEGGLCKGMAVGLVTSEGTQVLGYGVTSAESGRTPAADTVFEIGSVSKVFTALLLADMVKRGEVALDDPVQKFLPQGVKLAQRGDQPITLRHLATHQSGLPRMPDNFAPKDIANPYADYTAKQMYSFLNSWKPTQEPGKSLEYSNLGLGLLGHLLSERAGKSYEGLIIERIAKPLGLTDTRIEITPQMRKRLAQGHDVDGNEVANWDLDALAGAGALRSTAGDMLKFVSANLGLTPSQLQEALALTHQPQASINEEASIGLAWHLDKKVPLVMHNGQTGGYHCYVAFTPGKKVGVVLLANSGSMHVDDVGEALLKRLLGQEAEPPKIQAVAELDPKTLDRYVGEYPLSFTFALTISREGDRFYCQATGQPKFRIYPESELKFYYRVVDAQLTFTPGEDGAIKSLTLHQNGQKLTGDKKK